MNSKEIKVNNSEELITKIKELVAEDSNWKLVEEYWTSSIVSYEPDGSRKVTKKPRQGVRLAKERQKLDIYCEAENPFNDFGGINERMKNYLKMSEEVNKIIERVGKNDFPSRPTEPTPYTPPTPPSPISDKKDSERVFWSSRYVGCPSLERAKELIKEYYQEHQKEIQENVDFSRWIKVESMNKVERGSNIEYHIYVGKLKKNSPDLPDWQKELHDSIDYMSKSELVLGMGSNYQSVSQIEKELKNFWNNLTNQNQHPAKNSNENAKKPNDKDNWLAKGSVIFLIITLLMGGIIIIYRFMKRKKINGNI